MSTPKAELQKFIGILDKRNLTEIEMRRMVKVFSEVTHSNANSIKELKEEVNDLKDTVDRVGKEWEEAVLANNMCAEFVKSKGLRHEFDQFVENTVDNAVFRMNREAIRLV